MCVRTYTSRARRDNADVTASRIVMYSLLPLTLHAPLHRSVARPSRASRGKESDPSLFLSHHLHTSLDTAQAMHLGQKGPQRRGNTPMFSL